MMCLQTPLAKRLVALAGTAALAAAAASCTPAKAEDVRDVGLVRQAALSDVVKTAAKACGLACPGDTDDKGVKIKGIAEGNASISGVASVDAFFGSVVSFQNAASGVSAGIKAQLDAIRGDFGIAANADLAAELDAKFKANLEGAVEFKVEPPRCEADIQATLKAKARCEGEVNPGSAKVECSGSCQVDASVEAKCDANADLECTIVPPNLMCEGSCQGSCNATIKGSAACSGTCHGQCDGTCSAYVKTDQGVQCSGQCSGMCTGSCEVELAAKAQCMGECRGECTLTNPMAGCKGAIRAECKAKAGAKVMCDGKCDADIEPPSAKVECQASAKAEAKINVQCTPPRASLTYKLKAGVDAMAQAKFEAALKVLVNSRLPALKAAIAKANSVTSAGKDLGAAATGAVKGAFEAATDSNVSVRVIFGLSCASTELPKVQAVIEKSTTNLKTQLDAAAKVTGMLKV